MLKFLFSHGREEESAEKKNFAIMTAAGGDGLPIASSGWIGY